MAIIATESCSTSEDGHEEDGGVGQEGLEDSTVPAGGKANQQAGEEHCGKDCCYHHFQKKIIGHFLPNPESPLSQCKSPTMANGEASASLSQEERKMSIFTIKC